MPASIRLMRIGKRGNAFYRIVVADKRKKRSGRYIENIGVYNPLLDPPKLSIDKKRFDFWLKNGAVLSEGIRKLKLYLRKSVRNQR